MPDKTHDRSHESTPLSRPAWQRYGFTLLATGVVIVVRLFLDPLLGEHAPLLLSVLAVAASAWFGGFGPGLAATVLSTLIGAYLFVDLPRFMDVPSTSDLVRIALFLAVSLVVNAIVEAMHRARSRAEARGRQLEAALVEKEMLLKEVHIA